MQALRPPETVGGASGALFRAAAGLGGAAAAGQKHDPSQCHQMRRVLEDVVAADDESERMSQLTEVTLKAHDANPKHSPRHQLALPVVTRSGTPPVVEVDEEDDEERNDDEDDGFGPTEGEAAGDNDSNAAMDVSPAGSQVDMTLGFSEEVKMQRK